MIIEIVFGVVLKSYGDYSSGVHLFPFRTESLSPLAQMVLLHQVEEYVVADLFYKTQEFPGFFYFHPQSLFSSR